MLRYFILFIFLPLKFSSVERKQFFYNLPGLFSSKHQKIVFFLKLHEVLFPAILFNMIHV